MRCATIPATSFAALANQWHLSSLTMARPRKPKGEKSGRTSAGILPWREGRLELLLGYPEGSHFARESTTRLLLPEFLERTSLRMTRWSSPSTTFRESFVHHVRGPYSSGHREAAYEWERLETCGCRSVLLVVVARCNGKCVTAHPAAPLRTGCEGWCASSPDLSRSGPRDRSHGASRSVPNLNRTSGPRSSPTFAVPRVGSVVRGLHTAPSVNVTSWTRGANLFEFPADSRA